MLHRAFSGIILGSRVLLALSWMTLKKVPGDIASWHQLYLAAKPPHVGVDVDGLAYPVHHPMACGHQMRGHGCLSGDVLSCHYNGRWCLSRRCKALEFGYLMEC
jgi:hypothetical protein